MLVILAGLAVIGGWVGWPAAIGGPHPTLFQRWLAPVLLPIDTHAFHFPDAISLLQRYLVDCLQSGQERHHTINEGPTETPLSHLVPCERLPCGSG